MPSFFLKGYIRVQSDLGGYGEIECQGNETKLEECVVRKEIRLTCQRVAVATHCSTSKICPVMLRKRLLYIATSLIPRPFKKAQKERPVMMLGS